MDYAPSTIAWTSFGRSAACSLYKTALTAHTTINETTYAVRQEWPAPTEEGRWGRGHHLGYTILSRSVVARRVEVGIVTVLDRDFSGGRSRLENETILLYSAMPGHYTVHGTFVRGQICEEGACDVI